MDYKKIDSSDLDLLWELHKAYKAEIGEDEPGEREKERLADAIRSGEIYFFGAWDGKNLAGC